MIRSYSQKSLARINSDAALVWKFQRFDLLKSYHSRPALIPPFNLIYHPIKVIM